LAFYYYLTLKGCLQPYYITPIGDSHNKTETHKANWTIKTDQNRIALRLVAAGHHHRRPPSPFRWAAALEQGIDFVDFSPWGSLVEGLAAA